MTYTTLDNWQAQLTGKGLSHNDTVRLLQDAKAERDALRAALREFMHADGCFCDAPFGSPGAVVSHTAECDNAMELLGEVKG